MGVYKLKSFARFQRRERIGDQALCKEMARAEKGLIDADLGGGLIKQRVARSGQGRSGGFRVIIAYRSLWRSVFLIGFAKSEKDNIEDDELDELKRFGRELLSADDMTIGAMVDRGDLTEIHCEDAEEDGG